MSSPIHQAEDLDPALRYAPRWARERVAPLAGRPPAPPVLPTARRARPEFSGDRAMLELQRRLVLDPDAIPEPMVDDARVLGPIALRLSAVIGLAALIAWGVVSLPGLRKVGEILPPDVKTPAMAVNPVKPLQVQASDGVPQANEGFVAMNDPATVAPLVNPVIHSLASSQAAPAPAQAAPAPSQATLAPAQAAPGPSQAAPVPSPAATESSKADGAAQPDAAAGALHLDGAEIASLIKRGKDVLMTGDIVSARLLLRRAAAAGSAEAALALGATFDPLVIQRLGAIGMTPDVAQARQWYERAVDLGSTAAPGQLAKLERAQ